MTRLHHRHVAVAADGPVALGEHTGPRIAQIVKRGIALPQDVREDR
jgi:hypothetical protein